MENTEKYQSAKKKVEARMGFYRHLSIYVAVILFLVIINFVTSPGTIWFHWPMIGWGIAIVIHAAFALVFSGRVAD